MSTYVLTEVDKQELAAYHGCNTLDDSHYNYLMRIMRKPKWTADILRGFNQMIDDGLGYFLYQLFTVRGQHPLFLKYYGSDHRIYNKPRSMEELMHIARRLETGEINIKDLPGLGCRVRSTQEVIPDHERKAVQTEHTSQTNNYAATQGRQSNKDNTRKVKR